MGIIYFIVVFLSCILGAIVGLGGGMFFRPVLDAIGAHNVLNIGFFISCAILTMSAVSTVKKMRDGTKINFNIAIPISLGSVLGGVLGNLLLEYLVRTFNMEANVQYVQIIFTSIIILVSLTLTVKSAWFSKKITPLNATGGKITAICFALGVFLGAEAAFLGIGGGPINVPVFIILFGFNMKQATAYSIVIVFFSHLSRLITMGFTVGYSYFDLPLLAFIIPAAALGGFFGAKCSNFFTEKTVKKLFIATVFTVILLNIFTGIFML